MVGLDRDTHPNHVRVPRLTLSCGVVDLVEGCPQLCQVHCPDSRNAGPNSRIHPRVPEQSVPDPELVNPRTELGDVHRPDGRASHNGVVRESPQLAHSLTVSVKEPVSSALYVVASTVYVPANNLLTILEFLFVSRPLVHLRRYRVQRARVTARRHPSGDPEMAVLAASVPDAVRFATAPNRVLSRSVPSQAAEDRFRPAGPSRRRSSRSSAAIASSGHRLQSSSAGQLAHAASQIAHVTCRSHVNSATSSADVSQGVKVSPPCPIRSPLLARCKQAEDHQREGIGRRTQGELRGRSPCGDRRNARDDDERRQIPACDTAYWPSARCKAVSPGRGRCRGATQDSLAETGSR